MRTQCGPASTRDRSSTRTPLRGPGPVMAPEPMVSLMTTNGSNLPRDDDLPVAPGVPAGSSWGLWGEHDVFGCLNLMTPDRRRGGEAHPARCGLPPQLGHAHARLRPSSAGPVRARGHREAAVHRPRRRAARLEHPELVAVGRLSARPQPVHGHYGGVPDEEHGIHHWASRGLVGRAVLADVGRWRAAQGRPLQMDQPDAISPTTSSARSTRRAPPGTGRCAADAHRLGRLVRRARRRARAPHQRPHADGATRPASRRGHRRVPLGPPHRSDRCRQPRGRDLAAGRVARPERSSTRSARIRRACPRRSSTRCCCPCSACRSARCGTSKRSPTTARHDGRYECFFTSAPLNLPAASRRRPNALAIK